MRRIDGIKISDGIAIGKLLFYKRKEAMVNRRHVEETEGEIARYETARDEAVEQLNQLYEKALKEVGEMHARIFEVHAMMLGDEDYNDAVYHIIRTQKVNAEYATAVTGDHFSHMFADMKDAYFRERATDVKDISERVIRILTGMQAQKAWEEPVILLAEDLAPSETIQIDKRLLLGMVTHLGSGSSHTAILARSMGIPALTQVQVFPEWDGKWGILDGQKQCLILDPDEETLDTYRNLQEKEKLERELLFQLKGKDNITKSGQHIHLYANMGRVSDLAEVLKNDAEGIGLFRTEFLYLESDHFPTEEEQFQAYKTVAETMAGKKVIIRTLDLGADKQVDYFPQEKEDNPALGCRAIRICLTHPEIFKTQLRAIYRAGAYGNISIMYPMITSVEEEKRIKIITAQVKEELQREGIPFGVGEEGIMIETPAAAIISDLLAKEVDFFSIGTNDLTQYTLAIDRQNAKLESFFQPHHEAVLRLIEMVVRNAHAAGIWAGICGELGADGELTAQFIRMGVDELSVSPRSILLLRKHVREME